MPIAAIPDVFSRDQWSETSLGTSCCASDRDDAKVEVVVVKMIIAAALAAGVALTAVSPADARQGCGPGHHRGPYGGCRINRDRMMRAQACSWSTAFITGAAIGMATAIGSIAPGGTTAGTIAKLAKSKESPASNGRAFHLAQARAQRMLAFT
jgi:hypothetical protein